MNNTLSTALVILAVLWLVRDVYALESKRRPGKSDFFFDDAATTLETPWATPANSLPLQRIIQSVLPGEGKSEGSPNKSEDKMPPSNLSFLGNIGSLTDVWKLLHHVVSLLNPLANTDNKGKGPPDGNRTDVDRKFSPRVNRTGTTPVYGDIDLDETFETTVEYASGNDSVDDEDYDESMNFSSPNPQSIFTSQSLESSSYVTPKPSNQNTTEPYNDDKPVRSSEPPTNKETLNSDAAKSPDMTDGIQNIPQNEFMDDYINKFPRNIADKDSNITSAASKDNEMEPQTSTENPVNCSDSAIDNETASYTQAPVSSGSINGPSEPSIPNQYVVDIPSEDLNCTQTPVPGEDVAEISQATSVSPMQDNPLQNTLVTTQTPDLTGLDGKPNNFATLISIPSQKTTTAPDRKPLKRPNINKNEDTRKDQDKKLSTIKPKTEEKALLDSISTTTSTTLPLQKRNDNLQNGNPFLTQPIQLPQLEKNANQIMYDKPSLLVNPYNNPFTAKLRPAETIQPLNTSETPQNQLNERQPLVNQSNYSKRMTPQNQPNERQPLINQPNYSMPMAPQNQFNGGQPLVGQPNYAVPMVPQNQPNERQPLINQPNYAKPMAPQNQLNEGQSFVSQPNYAVPMVPQNQPNERQPLINQPNYEKPMTPQNQFNGGQPLVSQPNYAVPMTPQNQPNERQPLINQPNYSMPMAPQNKFNEGQPLVSQLNYEAPMAPQNKHNERQPIINQPNYAMPMAPQNQFNRKQPSESQPNYAVPMAPQNQPNQRHPLINQPNYALPMTPQSQLNERQPLINQPNYALPMAPQNQLNVKQPSESQPSNAKLMAPQSQTPERGPSENNPKNTSLLTSHDQKSLAAFLNQFPRIKALLPKISNLPLLQTILGNASDYNNTLPLENCTDEEGLLIQNNISPTTGDFTSAVLTTPYSNKVGPSSLEKTMSPSNVQQSTEFTKSPPALTKFTPVTTESAPVMVTPQFDSEDLNPDDSDDSSPDEYNDETDDDPPYSDDSATSDFYDSADDTDDNADDTDDDTDDNADDDDEYNEEIDDLSIFDNSQEVISSTTTITLPPITSVASFLEVSSATSLFEKKNCTKSPTNDKKPPKKFNTILEYLYDNSKNSLITDIKKHQKKTMS